MHECNFHTKKRNLIIFMKNILNLNRQMDKNKLSYYASYVAIACGILILVARIIGNNVTTINTAMGVMFIAIGAAGLRRFRNKQ